MTWIWYLSPILAGLLAGSICLAIRALLPRRRVFSPHAIKGAKRLSALDGQPQVQDVRRVYRAAKRLREDGQHLHWAAQDGKERVTETDITPHHHEVICHD
jgi:phosphate/sulfate permease